MYVRNKLLTDTILAEPTWSHICFAEQDAADAPGAAGGGTPPGDAEELDLSEDAPGAGDDDELVEVEIGPDKLKVTKPVKSFLDGVHAKTQADREATKAEREAIRVEKETVAKETARLRENEKIHSALIDEISDARGVEKQIKNIDEKLAPYLKLSASDWLEWARQEPEKAAGAEAAVRAHQMERAGLEGALAKALKGAQDKYAELQRREGETKREFEARQAQMERDLPSKIKDWSPAKREAIVKAAAEHGLTADEMAPFMTDARVITILDKAAKYDAAVARMAKAKATVDKTKEDDAPVVEATPKVRTGAGSTSSKPRDEDSPDDWLKKRNIEVAARRAAKRASGQR